MVRIASRSNRVSTNAGFTLIEVVMAMLLVGITVTGIVAGFIQSHRQAEWASYSLAAQSLALTPLEEARAAKWDPYQSPPTNQITTNNFPLRVHILDVPISGTNIVYATNRTFIRTVSTNPPLLEISVQTTWRFANRGIFTNTALTYRGPDQ